MPCFYPRQALDLGYKPNGKRNILWSVPDNFKQTSFKFKWIPLPCGNCIGCRLERSRQWAVRCMHEASLYGDGRKNCFITLTFNDDAMRELLPYGASLDVKPFQDFMMRLRKDFTPYCPFAVGDSRRAEWLREYRIRYFHCGEYGEQFGRPHYHACLFNHNFDDQELWKVNNGVKLYTSKTLSKLWGTYGQSYGHVSIGEVNFNSAAYVARYIMKKVNGEKAEEHYARWVLDNDGEQCVILDRFDLRPEYVTMSRRPGIAKSWFDQYKSDIYPHDFAIVNDRKVRPPRYYDSLYEIIHPEEFQILKQRRIDNGIKNAWKNTPQRLHASEQICIARTKKLIRTL